GAWPNGPGQGACCSSTPSAISRAWSNPHMWMQISAIVLSPLQPAGTRRPGQLSQVAGGQETLLPCVRLPGGMFGLTGPSSRPITNRPPPSCPELASRRRPYLRGEIGEKTNYLVDRRPCRRLH